ncbi:MAG: tetratricopeptide repeat protein [Pyrinomonadaceae bacterium]
MITVGDGNGSDYSEFFENAIAEGNAARNRRLYSDAEKAYKKARNYNPNDSRSIYGLGNIYSDQQRWEEAERAYRSALEIEPDNPMASIALSYVLTQPVVGVSPGERFVEAEKTARNAIELDPTNAIGYDQLGVALELRGLIGEETESAYRKAVALDSKFALAYSHLGRLLRKNGRTNESSAAYRQAITLATDVPTMILVAEVMQSQQRYLDSEQLLREALRRDPRNPTGLYLLGKALTFRKNFDEAEAILKKSVEVSPASFVSYALLGSMYSQSGEFAKAEDTLSKAMTVVSPNERKRLAMEFERIGDGLARIKKNADAARIYRRAATLDSDNQILNSKIIAVSGSK